MLKKFITLVMYIYINIVFGNAVEIIFLKNFKKILFKFFLNRFDLLKKKYFNILKKKNTLSLSHLLTPLKT
jgi:hypothetical protein